MRMIYIWFSQSCAVKQLYFERGFFSPLIRNITYMHKQKSLRHKPKNTICNIQYSKIMSK